MTSSQIALIRSTFPSVRAIGDQFASLFYARLFELDPSLRQLFHGRMSEQSIRLMQALDQAVEQLTDLDTLRPYLQQLGARHVGYGVRDEHYATVGAALLWTLQQALGPRFTVEAERAWSDLYTLLSDCMRSHGSAADAA